MGRIKSIVVGLLAISGFIFFAVNSDWSPLNLIFGPQYQAQVSSKPNNNSRDYFITVIVPKMYPELIRCLQDGPNVVQWRAQSGETQTEKISLVGTTTIKIENTVYTGGTESNQPITVEMLDESSDGILDTITYIQPSGKKHVFNPPFDETSQYLWDSGLAIAFKESSCFESMLSH